MLKILETPDEWRKYVNAVLSSADVVDYSLSARAFVERHIKIFYNPLPPAPDLSAPRNRAHGRDLGSRDAWKSPSV